MQSRFKSRKILRKEARKAKKQRRNDYYCNRSKRRNDNISGGQTKRDAPQKTIASKSEEKYKNFQELQDYEIKKEKKKRDKLDKDIKKKRIERLKDDNIREEKEIKKLEKQLKFRKGKRSGAFALDGLDYLLDVCDHKVTKNEGENTFHGSDSEFEDDLATITGKNISRVGKREVDDFDEEITSEESEVNSGSNFESDNDVDTSDKEDLDIPAKSKVKKVNNIPTDYDSDVKIYKKSALKAKSKKKSKTKENKKVSFADSFDEDNDFEETNINSDGTDEQNYDNFSDGIYGRSDLMSDDSNEIDNSDLQPPAKKLKSNEGKDVNKKSKTKLKNISEQKKKSQSLKKNVKKGNALNKGKVLGKNAESTEASEDEENLSEYENEITSDDELINKSTEKKTNSDSGVWEDIYGRMRDKHGNVITTYKPPQMRKILSGNDSTDQEKLLRLKKQLKGLLNRLAENNMASISSQIEELYMSHSRNDMNETLKNLINDSIITEILTPERLIIEHAMLIAILNANVGSEVGAYFLQFSATQFHKLLEEEVLEDKRINNLLLFIMHLYNFKLFQSKLMYDIIEELLKNVKEKQIELILLTLKTVGFSLRKDNPMALKSVVLKIQEQANSIKNNDANYSRMKYMLEVVSAVKNNNVSKIPNYNPEHVEHLKKNMKVLIRKGNYQNELNISLKDLLNAEEHGRWWIVGSAWTGAAPNESDSKAAQSKDTELVKMSFSDKLLELAKKQRMNTDVRRTIFCILMSAEDYLDAFEGLLKLGLKGAVEREIINVLVHCAIQEKEFNPYYFHLGNKFCIFNRRFQMMLQCAIWDKLKELNSLLPVQVTNLAKFLGNIILSRGLPLSVLKVIHFSELDKTGLKFIRQVLLTILLADEETVIAAFSRVVQSAKLKVFRDGIRLFLHHFLLKNAKNKPDENSDHIIKMIDVADKILTSSDFRLVF